MKSLDRNQKKLKNPKFDVNKYDKLETFNAFVVHYKYKKVLTISNRVEKEYSCKINEPETLFKFDVKNWVKRIRENYGRVKGVKNGSYLIRCRGNGC